MDPSGKNVPSFVFTLEPNTPSARQDPGDRSEIKGRLSVAINREPVQ